jgi:hypothetical protein
MGISGTLVIAITTLVSLPVVGQPSKPWTAPLTPDGHPDLQGMWLSRSATPLERPKALEGRASLTDAEVAELKRRAAKIFSDSKSDYGAGDAPFLAALANVEHYKNPNTTGAPDLMIEREFDNRTSLIVDPPDGRIPPLTAEAQKKLRSLDAALAQGIRPPTRVQDLTTGLRCITYGVPRLGGRFGASPESMYQFVQTPGYLMIVMEVIHDVRIIPLDGRPHLPANMRTWNGDPVGHWEGRTLVVDTTNFSPKSNFMGSAENLHLVERFTRVAPDEIDYEMTMDDPTTWTNPWTAMIRLKLTADKMYEYACHEGNSVLEEILKVSRSKEKAAGN